MIFIAIKNLSPRPGLNSLPLGPVASTLTTTSPRRQVPPNIYLLIYLYTYIFMVCLEGYVQIALS
jgi:hypothetical protein